MFDEIVIIDRWASHRHNPTTGQWNKMNADVFRVVDAPKDWWAPVRESMMLSLGIENVVSGFIFRFGESGDGITVNLNGVSSLDS